MKKRIFFILALVFLLGLMTVGSYYFFLNFLRDRDAISNFKTQTPRPNIRQNKTRPPQNGDAAQQNLENPQKLVVPPYNVPPQPPHSPQADVQRSLRTIEEINRINQMNQRLMDEQRRIQQNIK